MQRPISSFLQCAAFSHTNSFRTHFCCSWRLVLCATNKWRPAGYAFTSTTLWIPAVQLLITWCLRSGDYNRHLFAPFSKPRQRAVQPRSTQGLRDSISPRPKTFLAQFYNFFKMLSWTRSSLYSAWRKVLFNAIVHSLPRCYSTPGARLVFTITV